MKSKEFFSHLSLILFLKSVSLCTTFHHSHFMACWLLIYDTLNKMTKWPLGAASKSLADRNVAGHCIIGLEEDHHQRDYRCCDVVDGVVSVDR